MIKDDLKKSVDENLHEGQIVKNYRELCTLLNEEVKGGKGKKYQLENWECYFSYSKRGNKFVIEKIFDKPLPKIDGREKGNNTIYVTYIEAVLLHLLSLESKQTLTCTKNYLLYSLGMVNNNYNNKHVIDECIENDEFTSSQVKEFNKRVHGILDRILFTALDNLQKRFLINYKQEIHYVTINQYNDKIEATATEEEERIYTSIKYDSLKELGVLEGTPDKYSNMSDVFIYGKEKKFFSLVNKKAYEKLNWISSYTCYKITYTKKDVIDAIPKLEQELQRLELNNKVVLALNKNAETHYNNMLDNVRKKYEEMNNKTTFLIESNDDKIYFPPTNYVEKQQQLTDKFIKIQTK